MFFSRTRNKTRIISSQRWCNGMWAVCRSEFPAWTYSCRERMWRHFRSQKSSTFETRIWTIDCKSSFSHFNWTHCQWYRIRTHDDQLYIRFQKEFDYLYDAALNYVDRFKLYANYSWFLIAVLTVMDPKKTTRGWWMMNEGLMSLY